MGGKYKPVPKRPKCVGCGAECPTAYCDRCAPPDPAHMTYQHRRLEPPTVRGMIKKYLSEKGKP